MKKILLCLSLFILIGCSEKAEPKLSKEETYYNEILAMEDNMKALSYFKMNKSEDKEFLYCDAMNIAQIEQSDPTIQNYRFHQNADGLEYIASTKVADEIQYITQYYRGGKLYTSYSQMPYDLKVKDASAEYAYFDMAIKAVDLDYYTIKKKSVDKNTLYTITLKDAKGYNKKYPEDYNDKTCGIEAKYQAVKIELLVNADDLLVEEKITKTIHYESGELVSEKESITLYQFYDLGIEDNLDFSIIE